MSGRVRNFRFRPCYEDGYVNFQKIFVLAHVIYGHCTRISAHEDFDFSFPFFVCHSRRTELADSSRIEKSEDYPRRLRFSPFTIRRGLITGNSRPEF